MTHHMGTVQYYWPELNLGRITRPGKEDLFFTRAHQRLGVLLDSEFTFGPKANGDFGVPMEGQKVMFEVGPAPRVAKDVQAFQAVKWAIVPDWVESADNMPKKTRQLFPPPKKVSASYLDTKPQSKPKVPETNGGYIASVYGRQVTAKPSPKDSRKPHTPRLSENPYGSEQ